MTDFDRAGAFGRLVERTSMHSSIRNLRTESGQICPPTRTRFCSMSCRAFDHERFSRSFSTAARVLPFSCRATVKRSVLMKLG